MSCLINKLDELISMIDAQSVFGDKDTKTKLNRVRQFSYYPKTTPITTTELPYKFNYESMDQAKEYLFSEGFVVFKNVINAQEINTSKQLFWKWINEINIGWNKNNPSTWNNQSFPGYLKTGVIYKKGIGQSELQWFLRTRPKLLSIFTKLWNVNNYKDLLTSFDGIGIYRPYTNYPKYKTREQWFHVDQHYHEFPNFNVYQGLISLQKQNEYTGGTVIIPKSHLLFKELTKNIDTDFKKIPMDHWIFNNDEYYKKLLIQMDAGDLLIWDGRTIHCNTYSLKEKKEQEENKSNNNDVNEDEFLRMVSYITMSPKSKIIDNEDINDKDYMEYRLKAYRDKTTTGHWPHKKNIVDEISDSDLESMKRNKFESMNETINNLIGWNGPKPSWY